MCMESLVAIIAMIAACTLDPGVYLSMNIKAAGADPAAIAANTVEQVSAYGPVYQVSVEQMEALACTVHEHSLFGRTGGAAASARSPSATASIQRTRTAERIGTAPNHAATAVRACAYYGESYRCLHY